MNSYLDLPDLPPHISLDKIQKMTNRYQLNALEKKYDEFIDKNTHILMLYEVIEEYLEIRDALTIRLSKIKRETTMQFYSSNKYLLEE